MQEQLRILSTSARSFLGAQLPASGPDWWDQGVLAALTYSQRQTARERGWTTLDDLDLAALLRVVDQNWDTFRRRNLMSYEARNWLKEAVSVRNRWAHDSTARTPPARQAYRDLDTLALLCAALGAEPSEVAQIETARDEALAGRESAVGSTSATMTRSDVDGGGALGPGVRVQLIARPEVEGVVVEVMSGGPEPRFSVFQDGGLRVYYSSQLQVVQEVPIGAPITASALHSGLTSAQLANPSMQFLYSLNAGRIEFEPYQYRPVLKLIQSDRPRLLIADDVGVGKTIEAGLIIKELQARQNLTSVLVICPKPLVSEGKWRQELKRFDEDFAHLDSETLRHCLEETRLEGRWPARYRKAILPYSLLDERLLMGTGEGRRRRPGLVDLDPPPQFDLVIVDEAHHVRNTETWSYRNVRQLIGGAEAVLLLSATPIQTGNEDLFTLLNLLRPDVLPGRREFEQMAEPNPQLSAAAAAARAGGDGWQSEALASLQSALATPWGERVLRPDPRTQAVEDLLGANVVDDDLRVRAVRALHAMNTFSGLINRTRRRDIGEFTTRKPETVEVDFTTAQAAVYTDLIGLSREIARRQLPGQPVDFLLSTLQRQAASCLTGLAPLIQDILLRRLSVDEISEADGDEAEANPALLEEFGDSIAALAGAAEALGDDDPKFDAFDRIVREKLRMENNKLLVFSTFRHTLAYLLRRLDHSGARLGLVHGGVPDDERRDLRARFKLAKEDPQALDLLLSSEVGTEGLDYQFCDTLVNYDLPWNPMRVEQRIGRIDRRGQRSETVAIKNLVTRGTVDASIYTRCLYRIGVFQQALGGSEEILGELTREMRGIAENLSLTDEERDDRLRQLADNKLGRIHEQSQLEDRQAQLFGLAVRHSDETGVEDATSPWLTPQKLADLVVGYLADFDPNSRLTLRERPVATLRPSQEVRAKLLADLLSLPASGSADSAWEQWLRSSEPVRRLTVDPQHAEDRPDVELLGPTHPLIRAAARHASLTLVRRTSLRVHSADITPGRYAFGVYGWNRLGMRDDFAIQVVAAVPALQAALSRLLPQSMDGQDSVQLSELDEAEIETHHHALWSDARVEHREQSEATVTAQLASLRATHAARLAQLDEQLAATDNERIQRMRHSQLQAVENDFARRVQELETAASRCDLSSDPLVFGVLEVVAP